MKTAIFHGLFVFAVLSVACDVSDAPAVPPAEVDEPNGSTFPPSSTPTPAAFEADDRISCTDEVKADPKRHTEVLIEVKNRYRDLLSAIPNVNGLGVGVVYRDGERTDEFGIIVHFPAALLPSENELRVLVPSAIEGCTVSVQTAEPPRISRQAALIQGTLFRFSPRAA